MFSGERLKEERERLGFAQEAFASVGGVGRKSQFNYETEERVPDANYLVAIAKLGVDVQYLITGVRSDVALAPDERELLTLFRAAPLAVKAAAIGALSAKTREPEGKTVQKARVIVGRDIVKGGVVINKNQDKGK